MLIDRNKEICNLVQNIKRGIHTLVFGRPGVGKSVILREAANRLSECDMEIIYVNDCRSPRVLLEIALKFRHIKGFSTRDVSMSDLRNSLLRSNNCRKLCLILDHIPKLHHRLKHLMEIMEDRCILIFGVTADRDSYDLYYWRFEAIEITNLRRKSALPWIAQVIRAMNYSEALCKAISNEIFNLTAGNPEAIQRTLSIISRQTEIIDDPIRIPRMFIEGQLLDYLEGKSNNRS
jgi:replication-associated recombination protein RarA